MYAMSKEWYCVNVASNRIKSFQENLANLCEDKAVAAKFGEVFVPSEEVVEVKKGKRIVTERKFFANYVFLEMEMEEETYNLVKHLKMVRGFVGDGAVDSGRDWFQPEPIPPQDIEQMRDRVEAGHDKPKPKILFEIGSTVRIKEGSFKNFSGNVIEVNYETSRISVSVNVFNRQTPIQLDFEQVEKA